ncbi:MAG: hypothetical protein LBD64_04950 [Odoribacteraceae bacterium]|jgi:hypothetical protein|nr:hypothetical protein [Odoribacteraceae bacterium]
MIGHGFHQHEAVESLSGKAVHRHVYPLEKIENLVLVLVSLFRSSDLPER